MAEQQELADWFQRNADRRNPTAHINVAPEYFASECADAIMNGALAVTQPQAGSVEQVDLDEAVTKLLNLHKKMIRAVRELRPYPVSIAINDDDTWTILRGCIELERAKAVIQSLHPDIASLLAEERRKALEEAAKVADECAAISRANYDKEPPGPSAIAFATRRTAAADVASAIRALLERERSQP